MTDIEINTAISAACGWKPCEQCLRHGYKDQWRTPSGDGCEHVSELPNYCHNLNMMWEAEAVLGSAGRIIYQDKLIDTGTKDNNCCNWDIIHATARQRAEAFLRTIGRWTDK